MLKNISDHKYQLSLGIAIFFSIALNLFLIGEWTSNNNMGGDLIALSESEENILTNLSPENNVAPQSKQEPLVSEAPLPAIVYKTVSSDIKNQASLDKVFRAQGIDQNEAKKIFKALTSLINFKDLKAGNYIQMEVPEIRRTNESVLPRKLTLYANNNKVIVNYNEAKKTYDAKKTILPSEWKVKYISGKVNGSFFSSIKKAAIDPAIATQLVNLFSYDIDFQRDVNNGDSFKILYEYQTGNKGKIIKNPRILYATLNLGPKHKDLYRHALANGAAEYFDATGNSVKKALLKTPIKNARITSGFKERIHPVYGYSHMHPALDYGAPHGAPILAAGDGVIEMAKKQSRGYGNHVKIKHDGIYSTLYAHMSKFANNIKPGSRVKQGQVIGFVGSTGTATGPHLHYEVIERGKKVNPARIKIARSFSLKGKELAKFKNNINKVEQMVAELNYNKALKVAQLDK